MILKGISFLWFFMDFKGLEGIKIDEKSEKIEPGAIRNTKKSPGIARIGRMDFGIWKMVHIMAPRRGGYRL